jgi:hypothetical protein
MIFAWTTELIEECLTLLTPQQRTALNCFLSLSRNQKKPGPVRLKKYGFTNLQEYEAHLQSARESAIGHFAEKGIRRVDDVAFPEPDRSTEGRIQHAARKTFCNAAA